jgi:hypothetical protein
MNESNLWEWLRNVVLPMGNYSRIESPDTAPGFPDVHFTVTKDRIHTSGTLELKATDRNLRVPFPDQEKGLHESQLKWISKSVAHGGVVWIIAETPRTIYIVHGQDADWFNGSEHKDLLDMAWNTVSRDDPKKAFHILDDALRVPENYRLCKEYVRDNT